MTIEEDIKVACKLLEVGGIILYPTDTVWGIGCDATNAEAVRRVYELKRRADSKAMLVLIDNEAKLENYVESVPAIAWDLIDVSVKPLTIIYPKGKNLAPNLLADDGSIGIRVTREEYSRQLCARFGKPIVSTSANVSGAPSPSNFGEISDTIKENVSYVAEYRREEKAAVKPSNIIKLDADGVFHIIR